ncbi:hypothetical protein C1752_04439 [Acaryochloris thomasi RCC1774]|uniref:Uncharacterized protein n=1 Tax=Acaryochloris thomasi RCC1774 TaxID=1764569 RepID=A0A2W1JLT8_9CYAN|nr:hypothetical protein [Acaryochloris thomasi]PZD71842.1 hypothetical protein C1752_04439 [Acaryochloris thomasi RCC1774]
MALVASILAIATSIGSIVCWIIVLTKLFPSEGVGLGILGIICGLYTFIWGWQNVNQHDIKNIMLIWSFCFGMGIVLNGVLTVAAS